jgi:hypothetical protein
MLRRNIALRVGGQCCQCLGAHGAEPLLSPGCCRCVAGDGGGRGRGRTIMSAFDASTGSLNVFDPA